MSDKEELATAMQLAREGRTDQSSAIFVRLTKNTSQPLIKLQAALGIVGIINPTENNQIVLEMCDTGMEAAEQVGNTDAKAYLMAKKAVSLSFEVSQHRYNRRLLVLSPGWKGFSLEADQAEHERLTALIEDSERQSDELISEALRLSQGGSDQRVRSHILMMWADLNCSKFSDRKLENLVNVKRLRVLRFFHLDETLSYSRLERQEMRRYLSLCEESYLEAIRISESLDDEPNLAMAFYNFANHLRTGNQFGKATRYLARAQALGTKLNDQSLLAKAAMLEDRIRNRNRNVPNYVGGTKHRRARLDR